MDFDPIYQKPKPVQRPHPPIHVGGIFPGALRRALRYGNGWIPIGGRGDALAEALAKLPEEADAAGRDPSEIEISVYYAPTTAEGLAALEALGVRRAVFALPSVSRDEALATLDSLAEAMAKG